MTDTAPAKKVRRKFTDLEQCEMQRVRAIGAQAELRQLVVALREEAAQYSHEASAAKHALSNETARARTAERERDEARKDAAQLRSDVHIANMRLAAAEGAIDMLARLGTIPAAKPVELTSFRMTGNDGRPL